MALAQSPKIVTNGLVFAYDMGPNPGANKSWKGKPTTNLHTNTDTLSGWEFNDSSYSEGRLIAGTTSVAHFVLQDKPLVSGTVYTQSVEVKHDGVRYFQIAPSTGFSSNFAAFDLVEGTVAGGNTSAASIVDIGKGYYRCSYTATATSTTNGRMAFGPNESSTSRLGSWSGNGVNGVFLRNPQIEANSFATPFVNGTRSNTEALLDWAGNNTITISGLTYNSDRTFSFNGSSDYVSSSSVSLGSDPIVTVNQWIRRTANFSNGGYWGLGGGSSNTGINGYTSVTNKIGWDLWGQTTFHTGQDYPLNQWVNVCWVKTATTFTTSTLKIYINGVEFPLTTTVRNNSSTVNLRDSIAIGRIADNTNSYYAPGNIGGTQVYNRGLTATEVAQNFNALRGRYGI